MLRTLVRLATPLLIATSLAAQTPPHQAAVLAGGCFWGVQNLFEHVRGVTRVTSGFSGDSAWHAESVRIEYDPAVVSYGTLLNIFFTVAHDPTSLDRQGPDVGPEYRSAIFFANESQHRTAQAVMDSLARAQLWPNRIVTRLTPLTGFFVAPPEHQDYALAHPTDPYIVINDEPKVARLRTRFPDLFRAEPTRFNP